MTRFFCIKIIYYIVNNNTQKTLHIRQHVHTLGLRLLDCHILLIEVVLLYVNSLFSMTHLSKIIDAGISDPQLQLYTFSGQWF